MPIALHTATEVIERLRVIQGLCGEIATRLEDEASVQTIPRNFEYEGRRTALLAIAGEIGKTMTDLESISEPEKLGDCIQGLFEQVETRKKLNLEEQERNQEYQNNFRLSGSYFTPRGEVAGCEKTLEWLRESLKSAGFPQKTTSA
jgi:hypothetical protein